MGKFQIKRSVNNQFYWVLKSSNSQTLITSETYTTKQSCTNGILSCRLNIADTNFKKKEGFGLQPYYFTQHAGNGETIGKSEMYSSAQARDNGILAVKIEAPAALVEDLS